MHEGSLASILNEKGHVENYTFFLDAMAWDYVVVTRINKIKRLQDLGVTLSTNSFRHSLSPTETDHLKNTI